MTVARVARLDSVPYNTSAAWAKYPDLANILSDEPCTPKCARTPFFAIGPRFF